MADESNSIFDLSHEFGFESPFDNWLHQGSQASSRDAIILYIEAHPNFRSGGSSSQILPTIGSGTYFNTNANIIENNSDYVVVSVNIKVYVQYGVDKVQVTLKDKGTKYAIQNFNNDSIYETVFNVKVEKSTSPTIDRYNIKNFVFTAEVFDLYKKTVTDSKSIQVGIDTNGRISDSTFVRPIQLLEFHIYPDGKLREWTPDKIPKEYDKLIRYFYHEKNGKKHNLGEFKIKTIKNIYGPFYGGETVDLVDIRELKNYISDSVYFRLSINSSRYFMNKRTMGSLLGAMLECSFNDFVYNGFSNEKGESAGPSTSHKNGQNGDFRYLRKDKSGLKMNLFLEKETGNPCGWKGLDVERQNKFNDALYNYGWKSMLSQYFNGKEILNHCTNDTRKDHNDHLHVQGYDPDYKKIRKNLEVIKN